MFLCTGIASAATYSGGSGTVDDPYQLSSDSDIDTLSATSDDWGMNFTLTNNITLVGNHTPIANQSIPFTGDFDGNGYTIKNLTVYTDGNAGFFAYIGNDAYIHGIGIEASSKGIVTSAIASSGILAGSNNGTINNIYVIGNVTGANTGGLIGWNIGGTITNSYANSTVDGSSAGGLIGGNANANITNCYATGNVSGDFSAGGLIGNNGNANITNCYATGNVASSFSVGGLIGENNDANVINCYHSNGLGDTYSTSTSYENFTNFSFVSGPSGLNWNANGNVITTEYNPNFIWRINDGSSLPFFQEHPYSGGIGTIDDPYQLSNDADINELSATSDDWGMNFTLTNDITLIGNHTPIGKSSPYFTGDLDGNGYSITNLTVYETTDYAGLFGYTGSSANIYDLGVEASSDGVFSTSHYVGGLVGYSSGTVSNCSATGNVTGNEQIGVLVGRNLGTVSNSYSTGAASGAYHVGGLVGRNVGTVNNCYTTGNATSVNYAGDLVGSNTGTVSNSFATGSATASLDQDGGLIGDNNGGSVSNSYYSGSPSDSYGGISSSYENFTSFAFVSGASGLNWNVGSTQDMITTEDNSSFIWKIMDSRTLPYFQYQEDPISLALAGTPESFTNTTGNFWVNHSWSAGTGDVTDSYNVSYGESWQNDTITYLNHTGLSAHAWSNITVYAYNATDSTLSPGASDNVQVPNNEIGILNVTNITSSEGETISFDINFTDIDGDTPTFDCNQSSLFDDFNTSTGEGSWDIGFSDAGTYYVEFNVSDGYDSVDSQVMNITITNVPTMRVGSGFGYDYSSIQEAINDADDGDTIIVTDGIYNENVVVNKSVILRSDNGSGSTIVNASDSSDHVFNVIVSNVTIDGFNVTGVNAINKAGIYLSYSDNCTVRNNIVNTNYDGIVLVNSNYNLLTSNVASNNYKNGIYLSSSDNNTFTSCIANFNEQYGFYLLSSNNNTLTDNVANNNTYRIESLSTSVDSLVEPMESLSDGAPTGFYISSSDNNILTDNTANYNTGGYQVFMTSVSNNVVSPDIADVSRYSSGFSLSSSYNTTLADNTAIGNEDYAFYSSYSYDNTVDKLKMAESSMQLSFVTDFSEMAVGDNESISSAPTGMSNVNGYIDAASWYDPNMTIYYDDSGMSSSVESSISLFKLNGSEWVKVPNASLSTSGNYVSVEYYRPQNNAFNGISIDDLTSTFGLFKSIPSSGSRSDDDGVRASVSQGQDPGIVSNSASSVKRVTGGSPVNYDFADSGTPVLGVSFDAKDDKGLVVSKVQVLSSAPEGVPASSGNSYQMMSIDVGSEGTISSDSADNIMIHFKVSKQWIEENDIDLSTIRMTRYHGEQWNDLPTYQEREDGEYFYFYAETPGFSIFEVVGDEIGETSEQAAASESVTEEVEEPVEEETPDIPGFTILAGVVFVSLAVLTRRK